VTRFIGVLAVVALAAAQAVSANSSSAQLAIGVTVVRSCAVDARAAGAVPQLRLRCTSGAQTSLRVSETVHAPSAMVTAQGDRQLTLNF
jgi:hypothetical protein